MNHSPATLPTGRLIILTDAVPHPATMRLFEHLTTLWPIPPGDVCVMTGFSYSATLAITQKWRHLFYDPMHFTPLHQAASFLPWADIWVVSAGQVWNLGPDSSILEQPNVNAHAGVERFSLSGNWPKGLQSGS